MKKMTKYKSLVFATFGFLVLLLVVLMVWTNRAAKLEENLFNNRVEMALVSFKNELKTNPAVCENLHGCIFTNQCKEHNQQKTLTQIDQLLKDNLLLYNINLDYEFDLINSQEAARLKSKLVADDCYITQVTKILVEKGMLLKVKFPARERFLRSQMFGMFLISSLLILAVTISFIIMLRLYIREQVIAKQTKDFVNNMTHELKTPIANIGLANNMLRKQTLSLNNEKLNKYTSIIGAEKQKLQALAEEILTVTVLENGFSCNGFDKIEMHQLISKAAETSNLAISDLHGTLKLNLMAENSVVSGSFDRLMNVFTNLIDNSLKYNTNTPSIVISTKNEGGKFLVSVTDNGIGISEKDIKRVFDKYYRVPTGNVHNAKGFGLGLTFVKLVVDEHGGSVRIKSKPLQGSEVLIELPLFQQL